MGGVTFETAKNSLTAKDFIKPSLIFWFVVGMIPLNLLALLAGKTGLIVITVYSIAALAIRASYASDLSNNMQDHTLVFINKNNDEIPVRDIDTDALSERIHDYWVPFVAKKFSTGYSDNYSRRYIGAKFYFYQGLLTSITILPFYLLAIYYGSIWTVIRKSEEDYSKSWTFKLQKEFEKFNNYLDTLK